ncbi:MAG: HAMP domain-containing sensor histidine kinase [Gemmatimonadaceae bacterium]
MTATAVSSAEIEAALLGVLLDADTMRSGADRLLLALAPVLDDADAALVLRDRDGVSLLPLAETGVPQRWPERIDPHLAGGAAPGVDRATGVMVVPLRAHGRMVGALLLADAKRAVMQLRESWIPVVLDTTAAVLHAIASRTDAELGRRANKLRSVNAIADSMAHQMANPLTGASAIAELLIAELPEERHKDSVRHIHMELRRAFVVLNDMLDFHRDTRAQDGVLDVNPFVERVLRFRGYAIREQGIALELETLPEFMPVRADMRGLEHALLVALRYAELRSHGTINRCIAVRVRARGESEFCIEITDSGPGDVPEIENSYPDLPLTHADFGDDGLPEADLGVVNSILRGCGGRLEVSGSKTVGTTLSLVMPRALLPHRSPQATPPTSSDRAFV